MLYVCVYIYIYIYIYIYSVCVICMYIYIYILRVYNDMIYMLVSSLVCMYVCVYIYIYIYQYRSVFQGPCQVSFQFSSTHTLSVKTVCAHTLDAPTPLWFCTGASPRIEIALFRRLRILEVHHATCDRCLSTGRADLRAVEFCQIAAIFGTAEARKKGDTFTKRHGFPLVTSHVTTGPVSRVGGGGAAVKWLGIVFQKASRISWPRFA